MPERYLTPEEAASRLRVNPRTVRRWLRTRKLKGLKVGKLWRVKEADLEDLLLTPNEVAARLAISPKTVRAWLRAGKLRGVRVGGLWRLSETDVEGFLRRSEVGPQSSNNDPRRGI